MRAFRRVLPAVILTALAAGPGLVSAQASITPLLAILPGETLHFTLFTSNDPGPTVTIEVETDTGDSETLTVNAVSTNFYGGSIVVTTDTPVAGNGFAEASVGGFVTLSYDDAGTEVSAIAYVLQTRLVTNMDFETPEHEKLLAPWKSADRADKVRCATDPKPIEVLVGACAFVFKGGGSTGTLSLAVKNLPPVSPAAAQGLLTFDGFVKLGEGRTLHWKAKLTYANGKSISIKRKFGENGLPLGPPDQYHQALLLEPVPAYWKGIVADGKHLTKVTIKLIDKNSGGKLYVDFIDSMFGPQM